LILSKVRRELENILLLVDELEKRGISREVINEMILDEFERITKEDESHSQD
jgi:hypothetical protein